MRVIRLLAVAAVAMAAVGCGGNQPRIYRVALDKTKAESVQDAACFKMQAVSGNSVTETNLRTEQQWVVWDGASPNQYLDFGQQSYKLGDAPEITFSDLVLGQSNTFTAQRVTNTQGQGIGGQFVQVRQTVITVAFNDMGAAPTGTMALQSSYACQPASACPTDMQVPDPRSCKVTLDWVARHIENDRTALYQEEGK